MDILPLDIVAGLLSVVQKVQPRCWYDRETGSTMTCEQVLVTQAANCSWVAR